MPATPISPLAPAHPPRSGLVRTPLSVEARIAARRRAAAPGRARLDDEWSRLDTDPATAMALRRWSRRHPVLVGLTGLGNLIDTLDAATPDQQDALLLALLTLFQSGQQLAGRTVLQAMLPSVCRLAARSQVSARVAGHGEDRFQLVVCEFWHVLGDYPVRHRAARVAANLTMETLGRLTRLPSAAEEVPVEPGRIEVLAERRAVTGVDLGWGLPELLAWGQATGAVTQAESDLLTELYEDPPDGARRTGQDVTAAYRRLARAHGSSPAALRQRVHRARERLRLAVRAAAPVTG